MRRLLIVPFVAFSMLVIAATCVANVEQKGAAGPWVGEVTNMGDQTIHGAGATGRIYDADGSELHGLVGVLACPSKLLPGERGAFELFEDDPDFADLPGAPAQPRLPLRAEFYPTEDPPLGTGQARGDGLFVRELERDAAEQRVRVGVTNNSDAPYSQFTVCAVLSDAEGKLLEVASADGPPLPFALFPGDSIDLELHFNSLPEGTLRYHALGLSNAPYAVCCPPNEPSTWTSVKNEHFSVLLPPGWAYEPRQGEDSFVGAYVGDGVELTFDYGNYSDPLNYEGNPPYEVHQETIAGVTAKIVRAKGPSGWTGVHFADVGRFRFPGDTVVFKTRLTITVLDLTPAQQEIALQIFRSVRFAE